MDISDIARVVDQLATAMVFGATVWFFFVQSPVLLARMGREAFVPVQMRLTVVLFRMLPILLLGMAGLTVLHSPGLSPAAVTAGIALVGGLINAYVIVPRALRAGGRSRSDIEGRDTEATVAGFASEGAGRRTRRLHRLVVLFVGVMLIGTAGHGIALVA